MTLLLSLRPARPADGRVLCRLKSLVCIAWALVFTWFSLGSLLAAPTVPEIAAGAPAESSLPPDAGPTLRLTASPGDTTDNAMADFMYFVALISPEPVSVVQSPGNTQRARLVSQSRRSNGNSFVVTCEFEFAGDGYQRNVFDHSEKIRQNEAKLRKGAVLDHLLNSISVEGSGTIGIEVEGTMIGALPLVNEVRLRFNAGGRQSPVTIDLYDLRYAGGGLRALNETLARVNSLTFRKQPGPPRMDIAVASVRRKDAGDSAWESLKSKVKATAVNWVMDPVDVDPAGHEAMLNFGRALVSQAAAFTFPRARNLKPSS